MQAPKPLDKLTKDYDFKVKQRQRRDADSAAASGGGGGGGESSASAGPSRGIKKYKTGGPGGGRGGKRPGPGGGVSRGGPKARNELRSASDIQKNRAALAKRKEKNARPSKKKARRK
ncbi:hypothetical protein A4X13_0g5376 [Tilletia indica]|uniref:Uncharacterized protein n=1 Tax=Tilletia indica TaxID=43049 RepID=A0A8T8STU4_9BASI|nr:hypothetical protein A4X13_0g5376 [Tilletia indica]